MKKMYFILCAAAACAIFIVSNSSSMIKLDLNAQLENIMRPPKTAPDAYNMNGAIEKQNADMKKLTKELDETSRKDMSESPLGKDPEKKSKKMKKYSDPEMKKKIKNMSDEEKMALGMKMSREMGLMDSGQESPQVTQALADIARLNNDLLQMSREDVNNINKMQGIDDRFKSKYRDTSEAKEKCPKVQIGKSEGSDTVPDPKCVHQKTLEILNHNIQVEAGRLNEYQGVWSGYKAKIKPIIVQLNNKLASIKYGADIKDSNNKLQVDTAQTTALRAIALLLNITETAQKPASGLIADKIEYEKNYGKK
jgi:hypothetical protein